jgi:hypothetical protein
MPVKEFRDSMRKVQNAEDPGRNQKLVTIFKDNRKRFHPVMRHFFTERKKEPLAWFAMRLAYSRSLAVSNIVGYIVGIGDRHCSNILIDHSTGELVHIDFGVAFGQVRFIVLHARGPGLVLTHVRITRDVAYLYPSWSRSASQLIWWTGSVVSVLKVYINAAQRTRSV